MKEIKFNIISFILIIFAVVAITSLVVIEIVKYTGFETSNNISKNEVSIFEGDRYINFLLKEPTVKIDDQINIKPTDLVVKDSSAELFMIMEIDFEHFEEKFPLKCKIRDVNNNIIYESEDVGKLYEEYKEEKYYELTTGISFELENYEKDNANLIFELYNKNNKLLESIDINTTYNNFECDYDDEFEVLSEKELKRFLNDVSRMKTTSDTEDLIDIALLLDYNYEEWKYNSIETEEFLWGEDISAGYNTGYLVDSVDNVIESFNGCYIENKKSDAYEILEKDGKKYYALIDAGCGYTGVDVIDIKNIEYSNGKYKITYTYWLQGEQSELEFCDEYGQKPVYERTIELVKNEDRAPADFKILSISSEKECF